MVPSWVGSFACAGLGSSGCQDARSFLLISGKGLALVGVPGPFRPAGDTEAQDTQLKSPARATAGLPLPHPWHLPPCGLHHTALQQDRPGDLPGVVSGLPLSWLLPVQQSGPAFWPLAFDKVNGLG